MLDLSGNLDLSEGSVVDAEFTVVETTTIEPVDECPKCGSPEIGTFSATKLHPNDAYFGFNICKTCGYKWERLAEAA